MLGAAVNPILHDADLLIKDIAQEMGKEKDFKAAKVAVFFGEPGKTVKDPYFNGKGPDRKGCIHCGACMTGCRYNAKNTLDKNYLYLAQQLGAEIIAEKEVFNVAPVNENDSSKGYKISYKSSIGKKNKESITAKGVVFSGGVMGTIPLLLKLKKTSLPNLSDFVGKDVRTNNESLLSITSKEDTGKDFSKGLSIGSILHTDKNSHLEPVRYSKGSSFIKMMTIPTVKGRYGVFRVLGVLGILITKPFYILRTFFTKKYAEKTTILLFMQTLDSTLQLKSGRVTQMKTIANAGQRPNAFIPEALSFAKKVADKLKGVPYSNFTDVLLGTTEAYIETEDDAKTSTVGGGVAIRGSFLIDEDGNVRHEIKNDLPLGRNIDEMLRLIDALDYHNKHGEVCPAGWTEGKSGMKPSDDGMRDYLSNSTDEL